MANMPVLIALEHNEAAAEIRVALHRSDAL